MRQVAKQLALALNEANDVAAIFSDREYAINPDVTDVDLSEEFDITKADIGAFISAINNLITLRDDGVPTQGDWGAAINVVRES